MHRAAVAALLIGFLGAASCGDEKSKSGAPVVYPSADAFVGVDTKDALIVGVVHGPDGRPAAGVDVFADGYFWTMGVHESLDHRPDATTTDDEGRFVFRSSKTLREAARDSRLKVWAKRDDLVAPQVLFRVASRRPEVAPILTLGPSLLPKVKVVDPKGDPVANAYVELDFEAPPFDSFELLYTLGARSGADGVAVLPQVPDRPDWAARLSVNPKDMPLYADDDVSLRSLRQAGSMTVRLGVGCTLRGRVEHPDGSPAAGVKIAAYAAIHPRSGGARSAVTDEEGGFVIRGVPAERVIVHVAARAAGVTPSTRIAREVQGKEGEAVDIGTLRLVKTLSISGVVLGRDGKPASHGHVMPEPVHGKARGHAIKAGGRFDVTGLEPGRHTLTATIYEDGLKFFGGLEAKLEDVPAGSTNVEIRVTGAGNLIVRFHPLGEPDKPLAVWEPSLIAPTQGGSCHGGKRTEIRRTFKPGRYSEFGVEAEGYKEKALGPIEIHADRPTFVDVELKPTATSGK